MREDLQQVNHKEDRQKPWRDPQEQYPQKFRFLGIFSSFL